jgi:hypothetical protein
MSGSELTADQCDVIAAYEQTFWQTGSLPTEEKVVELTGVNLETIRKYWKQDVFRNAINARGIPLDSGRSEQLLTLEQLNLANRLLNMHDPRSVREKLNEVGVSSQQYHVWLRQPAFKGYLAQRGKQLFESSDHEAYTSLLGVIKGGDVSALKLYFEMRGIYNPRVQVDVNVEMVMVRVVEVIAKWVRDPQVLQGIAADLEMITIGQAVSPEGIISAVGMPVLEIPEPKEPTSSFVI